MRLTLALSVDGSTHTASANGPAVVTIVVRPWWCLFLPRVSISVVQS
jgi:hypothetical protein